MAFILLSWIGTIGAALLGAIVARLPQGKVAGVAAGTAVAIVCQFLFSSALGFVSVMLPMDQIEYWLTSKILGVS